MRAIDMHVHLPTPEYIERTMGKHGQQAFRYFGREPETKTIAQMMEDFEGLGIERMVILGWDAETATKLPPLSNDEIAALVKEYPDRLIGFGSVDPNKGTRAVKEAERALTKLELRGLKFHQGVQEFFANDPRHDKLWKAMEAHRGIALMHTGTTAFGGGAPGGGGVKLHYTKPMPYIDDTAAKFPDLKILAAHPGWPWHEENLAMVMHKANVYMDLSGWVPKYIPESVWKYANSLAQDKVLFGSDYPFLYPERWLDSFAKDVPLKPEVREKILYGNAKRLLSL